MGIDFQKYEFLDFGASKGGSIDFAKKTFNAGQGLGIDISTHKVEQMRHAGYDCMLGDITCLDIPDDAVRFVVISHLLEHLPGLGHVEATLRSAARAAADFIFIQGPFFDEDQYLEDLGLKFYWSDWGGHTCHLTTGQLRNVLHQLELRDYIFMARGVVHDSEDPTIHPLAAPPDQHDYDGQAHPPKPRVVFDRDLFREIVCCVRLRPFVDWPALVQIVQASKRARILEASGLADDSGQKRPLPALNAQPRLAEMHKRLLIDRRWDFLSYLHLRQALLLAEDLESVLVTNQRRGYQEIALALEFPQLNFHFVPPPDNRPQRYDQSRRLVETWELGNVRFGEPGEMPVGDFQLVAATDALDGSPEDRGRIMKLLERSRRYLWLLTSFDSRHGAYDVETLTALLPRVTEVRGCYWVGEGAEFRGEIQEMSDTAIVGDLRRLRQRGEKDLVAAPPLRDAALAFWVLAEKN